MLNEWYLSQSMKSKVSSWQQHVWASCFHMFNNINTTMGGNGRIVNIANLHQSSNWFLYRSKQPRIKRKSHYRLILHQFRKKVSIDIYWFKIYLRWTLELGLPAYNDMLHGHACLSIMICFQVLYIHIYIHTTFIKHSIESTLYMTLMLCHIS